MAKSKPTTIKMSSEDTKRQRQWEVEDAMRTLQRAEQIKRDGGMMRDIKKAAMDLNKLVMGGPTKSKPTPKKK
jgi:hypothetical protein